jgi:hypothetical protein
MTWINTPKKFKKNFPKKVDEDGQESGLREDESETEDESNKVLYFTDKDFQQRSPPPKY